MHTVIRKKISQHTPTGSYQKRKKEKKTNEGKIINAHNNEIFEKGERGEEPAAHTN